VSATSQLPLEISVQELKRRLDEGAPGVVIDVREPWETDICRIAGARLMPLSEFAAHLPTLAPAEPLYIYCHHGGRSFQAATWLRGNGFSKAQSVRGGIDAWSRDIDPSVPRY
jgi:rhodanese-related sulfurtransferase